MKNIVFSANYHGTTTSRILLAMRLFFGVLFIIHGYEKLVNFETLSTMFPDPFWMGSETSLVLVIIAEVFCAMALIAGFLFRLVLLPMIFTMGVAFFYAHGARIDEGELSLIYLGVFLMMYFTGPGRYSMDNLIYYGTCESFIS
jgi:putative oxidoreductase